MNKKEDISFNWLQRYTGTNPNDYGEWILLTNFHNYVEKFSDRFGSKINGMFSTITNPKVVNLARNAGIKIHWLHTLFDYDKGKKSFNHIYHFESIPTFLKMLRLRFQMCGHHIIYNFILIERSTVPCRKTHRFTIRN